jgi:hypothetical protein
LSRISSFEFRASANVGGTCAFAPKTSPEPAQSITLSPYTQMSKKFFKNPRFCSLPPAHLIDVPAFAPSSGREADFLHFFPFFILIFLLFVLLFHLRRDSTFLG